MTAQQLRKIRQSLNLSQTDFAAWLGEGVATTRAVQFWEAGDRKVPAYVRRIIELSNVSIEMPYDSPPED